MSKIRLGRSIAGLTSYNPPGDIQLMGRDVIHHRPYLTTGILVLAWGGYFFACAPHLGSIDADPISRGIKWCWIAAIPLSALFGRSSRGRHLSLAYYALATAWVFGGFLTVSRPGRFDPMGMTAVLFITAPLHLAITAIVEWLSQRVLRRVREFDQPGLCDKCGYPITNLTKPRCPECGEPFDEKWLKAGYAPPAVTSRPMRVYATIALIVLICLIFPHAWLEFDMRVLTPRQGRAQAQRDWGNGEPKWYILPNDPLYSIRFPLRSHHDPTTGLILEPDIPFGRRSSPRWNRNIHAWKLAYRAVIAAKLRRTPALPITAHLLDYDEMDTILNSGMTTPGSV